MRYHPPSKIFDIRATSNINPRGALHVRDGVALVKAIYWWYGSVIFTGGYRLFTCFNSAPSSSKAANAISWCSEERNSWSPSSSKRWKVHCICRWHLHPFREGGDRKLRVQREGREQGVYYLVAALEGVEEQMDEVLLRIIYCFHPHHSSRSVVNSTQLAHCNSE